MSILLDLMYASTIFEHSLSLTLRVGLYPRAAGCKGGKNFGEGGSHGSIILGGHSTNKDGMEVIDVRYEYLLHGFEGVDGECTQEVSVNCACVEVGKGGKTKHVMGGGDFFSRLETVCIAPDLLDDGWLHGACGLNALAVALHVALGGSCGLR
jgi:hypothetical protein